MLLATDIGNTHATFGVYEGSELVTNWRLSSDPRRTTEEYGVLLRNLALQAKVPLNRISGFAVCSVVPGVSDPLLQFAKRSLKITQPFVLSADTDLGIKINYDSPLDLGADRLANAIAAHAFYPGSVIVVDLGTATTFDVVSESGDFIGGAIAPGVGTSAEALAGRTAQLRRVPFSAPPKAIGTSTVANLQSGIIYGFAGQIDGIVERFQQELDGKAHVVATGGLADVIAPHSRTIKEVRHLLTLDGLRIAYDRVNSR